MVKIYQIIDDDCIEGYLFCTRKGLIKHLNEIGLIKDNKLPKGHYIHFEDKNDTVLKIHDLFD